MIDVEPDDQSRSSESTRSVNTQVCRSCVLSVSATHDSWIGDPRIPFRLCRRTRELGSMRAANQGTWFDESCEPGLKQANQNRRTREKQCRNTLF